MLSKYIYIDSKIDGTFIMLLQYFQNGVFDKNKYVILMKYYKTSYVYEKLLNKNNIQFICIKKWGDLPTLEGRTVFYLFNAQSNCRMVSYREATHIFIGHGESNKLSSAKPIFRIYDFIAVAGHGSIDRFLEQKIFTQCDVKNGKFLKVGSKFSGDAKYCYDEESQTILYAPTWEGGIQRENYSSINFSLESFYFIIKYMKEHNYKKIIIQSHPNMGHRDKSYITALLKGILLLKKEGFFIYMRPIKISFIDILLLKFRVHFLDDKSIERISRAFCDVSAMEIQLLDKKIPTFVFFNDTKCLVPKNHLTKTYYKNIGIYNFKSALVLDKILFTKIREYYIELDISQKLLGE